ncbi:MAG: glycoside hydrolase [Actinobacteria bacterium]|nr:glycoside hydrolase [Actinomycetota bacterium]
MRRTLKTRMAAAAALALCAAQGVAGAAAEAKGPRLTRPVQATLADLAPARTYTAPYLLVDPENDSRVFAATAELRSRVCRLLRSDDSGQSWRIMDETPSPKSYPFCSTSSGMLTQTPMAWGRDSRLYYAASGWDVQDGGPGGSVSVVLGRSDNLGESWTSTVVRDAPSLALDDQGTLYVLYPGAAPAAFPPTAAAPALPMLLAKSTDRGKTFTFTEVGEPLKHNEGVQILKWSPEGGAQGSLHMVYEDKPDQTERSADRDIYYQRSTNGGRTFDSPTKLNDDDPTQLRVQVTPNLSVAPDGRLDATWWDFRNDPGTFVNDVYMSTSTDNGATWSKNVRVTDRSINRKLGVWSNGYDIRQPPGMAATDELTLLGWDDTRLADSLTEGQDIFTRAAQFEVLGSSGSSAAGYVIAAFIGVAAVGLILLVVGLRRRRDDESSAPAPVERREPAGTT